jgi:hypothetical protein
MTKFIGFNVWNNLSSETKRHPDECFAAVAYFGEGASKQLPLKKGSTLVVNMSRATVKAGATVPSEVLKLIRRGVDVYHVSNLHAKVFVVANRAYVGSANVSQRSRDTLIEAAIETSDQAVVASCRRFVQSLTGERIEPEFAEQMQSIYKPPPHPPAGAPKDTEGRSDIPIHHPLWIVPVHVSHYDAEDDAARDRGLPHARKALRSEKECRIEEFVSKSHRLDDLKRDELIVRTLKVGHERFALPAARVLRIERYPVGHSQRTMALLEVDKSLKRKNLKWLERQFGPEAKQFKRFISNGRPKNPKLVHHFLNLLAK